MPARLSLLALFYERLTRRPREAISSLATLYNSDNYYMTSVSTKSGGEEILSRKEKIDRVKGEMRLHNTRDILYSCIIWHSFFTVLDAVKYFEIHSLSSTKGDQRHDDGGILFE